MFTLLRTSLVILCLTLLAILPAAASHLLGGEMHYKYLDANGPTATPFRYQITVLAYLNKEPSSQIPDGRPYITLNVYSKSQAGARILSLDILRNSFAEVTPPVSGACALPNRPPRVTLATYTTTVSLPLSFDGYYAVFADNTRNAGILNLVNSGDTNMLLYTEMAPPLLPNTSPVFSDTAVAVICQGDTSLILNNAYDADGDRLIYSFGTPYQGAPLGSTVFAPPPTSVLYAPGYTVNQPFGQNGFAALNANTGLSRYASSTLGNFVVAVDVKEYRKLNGREVLVGTTRRDVQLVVRPCPSNLPPVFTPPSVAVKEYAIEEGQAVRFTVTASDPEQQRLTMKVNSVLLDGAGPFNATFNNTPGTLAAGSATGSASSTAVGTINGSFVYTASCGDARHAVRRDCNGDG